MVPRSARSARFERLETVLPETETTTDDDSIHQVLARSYLAAYTMTKFCLSVSTLERRR